MVGLHLILCVLASSLLRTVEAGALLFGFKGDCGATAGSGSLVITDNTNNCFATPFSSTFGGQYESFQGVADYGSQCQWQLFSDPTCSTTAMEIIASGAIPCTCSTTPSQIRSVLVKCNTAPFLTPRDHGTRRVKRVADPTICDKLTEVITDGYQVQEVKGGVMEPGVTISSVEATTNESEGPLILSSSRAESSSTSVIECATANGCDPNTRPTLCDIPQCQVDNAMCSGTARLVCELPGHSTGEELQDIRTVRWLALAAIEAMQNRNLESLGYETIPNTNSTTGPLFVSLIRVPDGST